MMQRYQYFDTLGEVPALATFEDFRQRVQMRTGGQPPRGDLEHSFFPQFDFVKAIVSPKPEVGDYEVAVIDDSFSIVKGVPTVEWHAESAPRPTRADVSAERERRQRLTFSWNNTEWQCDAESTEKIMGLAQAAHMFLTLEGGNPAETKWIAGDGDDPEDFKFTAADNKEHVLNPVQMIQMAKALAGYVNRIHRRCKELQALDVTPYDYDHESRWD